MAKPVMLDLFCGAGGASVGYYRSGFFVVGVDIRKGLDYPYPFLQRDALEVLEALLGGETLLFKMGSDMTVPINLERVAAAHASPPCQGYTPLAAIHGNSHPKLIEPVRELLDKTGKPYVIENTEGAPIRRDIMLCGEMFDLGVIRHRYFELGGWQAPKPLHPEHRGKVRGWRHGVLQDGPYLQVHGEGGRKGSVTEWQEAMGINWTANRYGLAEAIPPAYSQWLGQRLRLALA